MSNTPFDNSQSSHYSGFLLSFERERTNGIEGTLRRYGEASESFSAVDWEFMQREVIFLCRSGERASIFAAVLMERMYGSGGTKKLKMRMSDPVFFETAIAVKDLDSGLPLRALIGSAGDLQRLSIDEWQRLVTIVKMCRPKSATALDELFVKRQQERRLLGEDGRIARLSEQRDAMGLCLDIGRVERREFLRTADIERAPEARSTFDLFDCHPVSERSLVERDARILEMALESEYSSAQFEGPEDRKVLIFVSDQTSLETVLGTDLLIYQKSYESFILLQYKAMSLCRADPPTWSYLTNSQLRIQMDAMSRARSAIASRPTRRPALTSFRLSNDPFFFKFCERTRPKARDDSLVRGLTMSALHLEEFLELPEARGADGGRRVGYDNCPRYFSNTEFVMLAQGGWIGCQLPGTELITDLLKAKEQGKAQMLAIIEGPPLVASSWSVPSQEPVPFIDQP